MADAPFLVFVACPVDRVDDHEETKLMLDAVELLAGLLSETLEVAIKTIDAPVEAVHALAEQLFTFVTAEPVEKPNGETLVVAGTNNEAERTLRSAAQARDTGRTNKTVAGARRQTVIVRVLESLRQHLSTFTLSSVIGEIRRWSETGRSCFARWVEKLGLIGSGLPDDGRLSLLDRVIPVPDG